jgi:hypothetical protein
MNKNSNSETEQSVSTEHVGTEVNRVVAMADNVRDPAKKKGVDSVFEGLPAVSTPKMPTPEELWVDPEKLAQGTAVKKIITVIPLRKPEPHEFFRTHTDPVWERPLVLVENKNEKRDAIYVVVPGIAPELGPMGVKYRMAYFVSHRHTATVIFSHAGYGARMGWANQ